MQHLACRVRRAEGPVEVTVSMDWAMPSPQPSLVPGFFEKFVSLASRPRDLNSTDIDWFVPHQANKRIIDGSAHKLGIAPEKVVITVDRHGNTSAASIPLALFDAVSDRRIKRGNLILLEAMGGGFTWGSALLRW